MPADRDDEQLPQAQDSLQVRAYANLALIKYWGKRDSRRNLPATPSIGINLSALQVRTDIYPDHPEARPSTSGAAHKADAREDRAAPEDSSSQLRLTIDGTSQEPERHQDFMTAFSQTTGYTGALRAESSASFPAGAGLASSAAGFAALALGCSELARRHGAPRMTREDISALARVGSGSAARAVIGGFSVFPAGAHHATQLADAAHWPDLRVVIATVTTRRKELSSRDAMERTRLTSPYFGAWVEDAERMADEAERRIAARDLEALGELVRASYARMHASMLAARPPIRYWLPVSLQVLDACDSLRRDGVPAFETMDAGPQVKILTNAEHVDRVLTKLEGISLAGTPLVSSIADDPEVLS